MLAVAIDLSSNEFKEALVKDEKIDFEVRDGTPGDREATVGTDNPACCLFYFASYRASWRWTSAARSSGS
jgi:hypothetical protein